MSPEPPDRGRPPAAGAAVGFGIQFAVGMALFSWLGWKLDQRRGGGQAFTLLGVFLGLGYGGYELWKLIRLLNAETGDGKAEK